MAKSLRSKWKRKMRAEKRVRYGEKEKIRLLNMLDAAKAAEENPIVRVTRVIRTREPEKEEGTSMDTTTEKKKVEGFSTKKLMNKNGTFPVWVPKRKIKKLTGKAKSAELKRKESKAKKSKKF